MTTANSNHEYEGENEIEDEIAEAKNDIKRLLREKREKQERRLSMMRKRAELRKHELLDKIFMMKSKYPSKVPCRRIKDMEFKCFGNVSLEIRDKFCDRNLPKHENRDENLECKDEQNFCFVCCDFQLQESEEERQDCAKMCDHEMMRRESENEAHKQYSGEDNGTKVRKEESENFKKRGDQNSGGETAIKVERNSIINNNHANNLITIKTNKKNS